MGRITVELDTREIEKALEKISPIEQKRLEKKLWALCMDSLVTKMRENVIKNKVTSREVKQICENVRQEIYEGKGLLYPARVEKGDGVDEVFSGLTGCY